MVGAHSSVGVAEHSPRLQYGSRGSAQARWMPPIFVHTCLVLQSVQDDPMVVHGAHLGNHGLFASHGGIHMLAAEGPHAGGAGGPQAGGAGGPQAGGPQAGGPQPPAAP